MGLGFLEFAAVLRRRVLMSCPAVVRVVQSSSLDSQGNFRLEQALIQLVKDP